MTTKLGSWYDDSRNKHLLIIEKELVNASKLDTLTFCYIKDRRLPAWTLNVASGVNHKLHYTNESFLEKLKVVT